jgi:hypothetical protein
VDNPQFSMMSISLHFIYLFLSVALILFHVIPLLRATLTEEGRSLEMAPEQKYDANESDLLIQRSGFYHLYLIELILVYFFIVVVIPFDQLVAYG